MGSKRRAELPPGVSLSDAWSSDWSIKGDSGELTPRVDSEGAPTVRSRRGDRTPCPCSCSCGSTGTDGGLCYLCGQGVHHICSRACRAYEPVPTIWHGIKALTNYIPPRQACGGGEDGGYRPGNGAGGLRHGGRPRR